MPSQLVLTLTLLLLTIIITFALAGRDYYAILEIKKNADEKAIKKSYRKLSMKYHPDTNGGSKEAELKFQDVARAYEVLSDKDKRRIYDQHGEEGLDKHLQQQNHDASGGAHDPFDIFSQFFHGGRRPQHREAQRGPDTKIILPVTLEDLYVGTSIEVDVQQQVLCSHCRGTGADGDEHFHTCHQCRGQGVVTQIHQLGPGFVQQVQAQCPVCTGKGKIIKKQCHVCQGKKREHGHKNLDVYIDQGMVDGKVIEFQHSGDEQPDMNPGHVVFQIQQLPHSFYTRENNDLKCEVKITLRESLTGFERWITHLDGHKVHIKRSSITKPNSVIKLKEEGMINEKGEHGVLHVKIVVQFPATLTPHEVTTLTSTL